MPHLPTFYKHCFWVGNFLSEWTLPQITWGNCRWVTDKMIAHPVSRTCLEYELDICFPKSHTPLRPTVPEAICPSSTLVGLAPFGVHNSSQPVVSFRPLVSFLACARIWWSPQGLTVDSYTNSLLYIPDCPSEKESCFQIVPGCFLCKYFIGLGAY